MTSDRFPEPALPGEGAQVPKYPFDGAAEGAKALSQAAPATRKQIVSWALWDWGTQPFATVITTFVFATYITGDAFGPENEVTQAHGAITAAAGFVVALLAPVLGQNSDRSGRTVRNLRNMTWAIALLSGALFFVRPEPVYLWVGLGIFALGTIIDSIAGVNNNAILDDISTPANVGRISGFGWGMGYLGGIIVLLICALGFILPRGTYWADDGMGTRLSMLICMVWILVFTAPTFLNLKDRPLAGPPPKMGVVDSYKELGRTIARIWRQSPHTIYFLAASALFRDGLAGVFAFGAVIAARTFGFSTTEVLLFGAAANILAGLSTFAFGMLDDRIGPKRVILITLGGLCLLGLAVFFLHDAGKLPFWVMGLMMTMFVGPAQSASRSFLARLVPEGRAGEVFGLYATTGRAISFLSPTMYTLFIGLGALVTGVEGTQYWGILGIVLVLLAGFVVMLFVKDAKDHATIAV